ncbi:class I SAM-dependent methyltransferase [Streptomyces goshikiensis]|uniref:class I SAM-dependent methyltransferase n=1 Tax=Streptomyces goshikiensis TaxID=1942 RepID=UPI0036885D64
MKIARVPQNDEEGRLALRYWTRFYSRKDQDCLQPTTFEVQQFQRHLWPAPGQVAVDVGCGRGRFASAMARTGMTVTGYDWAPTAIQQASERYSSKRLRFAGHNFLASADPAGVEPGSVDLVVCRLSLEYLDQKAFFAQVQRWLRPGTGTLHLVLEVTERQPPGWDSLSSSDAEINQLREGWRDSARWDLTPNGWLTALALRGPDHS